MKPMPKNIAVIGDSESVKGFGAIGLDAYVCNSPEQAPHLLRKIGESENYAIIYITESLFIHCEKERKMYEEKITPALVPIPDANGSFGEGTKRLSSFVERAVGSDIIFNN